MFKALLEDGDESAHFWLYLVDVADELLIGELLEVPPEFATLQPGQRLEIPKQDITDWCIVKSGTVLGGFTRHLQRARIKPEERRDFDLYSGMTSYAPLDEFPSVVAE